MSFGLFFTIIGYGVDRMAAKPVCGAKLAIEGKKPV
jgi:hypothetical protein